MTTPPSHSENEKTLADLPNWDQISKGPENYAPSDDLSMIPRPHLEDLCRIQKAMLNEAHLPSQEREALLIEIESQKSRADKWSGLYTRASNRAYELSQQIEALTGSTFRQRLAFVLFGIVPSPKGGKGAK